MPSEVAVSGRIELQQVVKLVWRLSGGEAKRAVQLGEVAVNGAVERRRSRRLEGGDEVSFRGETVRLVAK